MWHTLHNVATGQFFNPETFKAFALANRDRFQLDELDTVSTWFTNDLCKAYQDFRGPSAILEERNEHIRRWQERRKL